MKVNIFLIGCIAAVLIPVFVLTWRYSNYALYDRIKQFGVNQALDEVNQARDEVRIKELMGAVTYFKMEDDYVNSFNAAQ